MKGFKITALIFVACGLSVFFLGLHKHNFRNRKIIDIKTYKDHYFISGTGEKIHYRYRGIVPATIIGIQKQTSYFHNKTNAYGERVDPNNSSLKFVCINSNKDTFYTHFYYAHKLPDFPFSVIDTSYDLKIHYIEILESKDTIKAYPNTTLLFRDLDFRKEVNVFQVGFLFNQTEFTQ